MKRGHREIGVILGVAAFLLVAMLMVPSVAAQQVTGQLGSPTATTSIDGKQLPPPPPKFGGVIKESAKESTPWWPPRIVPPKGAPNVLLIMTDDQAMVSRVLLVASSRRRRSTGLPRPDCATHSSTPRLCARRRERL